MSRRRKFDPYEELEISRGASTEEVRAAYRRKARKTHPDKGGDRESFERAKRAEVVLSDPDKRKEYDETGKINDGPEISEERQAQSVIESYLLPIITGDADPCSFDILKEIGKKLEMDVREANEAIKTLEKRKARIEKTAARIKCKKAGRNILADVLLAKVGLLNKSIRDVEKDRDVRNLALAMLNDYRFEFDPPPPKPEQSTATIYGKPAGSYPHDAYWAAFGGGTRTRR